MTSRNGTGHQSTPETLSVQHETLATQLVTAKATGHVDGQLAPALLSLLEELYSSLNAGEIEHATASLSRIVGPALVLGQSRQTLVTSLVAVDAVLLDYQRRRGPLDAAALPSDLVVLTDLSGRLRQLFDAAEDAAERIDHYLRLVPAP